MLSLVIVAGLLILAYILYTQMQKGGTTPRIPGTTPPKTTNPPTGGTTTGGLSTAQQIMSTESMNIGTASGLIILLPNEAHETAVKARTSDKNGYYLPMNATVPLNTQIVFVSDDAAHTHSVDVAGLGKTGSIAEGGVSNVIKCSKTGTFTFKSGEVPVGGKITVTTTPSTSTTVVGAIFVPANDKAKYISILGGKIESESNFTWKADKQSVSQHTCIVYSSPGPITTVAARVGKAAKTTPYT
jgi:hypothetical protein